MKENNKGITLITLAITIVVLIILAAVGINALSGEKSTINEAKFAAQKAQEAEELERIQTEYVKSLKSTSGTLEEFIEYLRDQGYDVEIDGDNYYYKDQDGKKHQIYIEDDEVKLLHEGEEITPRVTNIQVVRVKNDSITFKVSGLKLKEDGVTLKYSYKKLPDGQYVEITGNALDSEITISGLEAETKYSIEIELTNASGETSIKTKNVSTLKENTSGTSDGTNPNEGGTTPGEDKTAPTLTTVTMASNNSNTAYAKNGDTITVNITASESLGTAPTITIGGRAATVTGSGTSWKGEYTIPAAEATLTQGVLAINISGYKDVAGNVGGAVTTTTNSSKVTYDRTAPTFTAVTMASITYVKNGNTVAVNITASESLGTAPTITIGGRAATVTGSGTSWKGEYTIPAAEATLTQGVLAINISGYKDVVGNVGGVVTTTTNSSKVTYDRTAPTISVSPTSCTQCTSKDVTITTADTGGAGLSSSNSYQYQLGTSNTAVPTGTWSNYTSGTSFTIGTQMTGTYYLWIKQISDNSGNLSIATTSTYTVVGTYVFDNAVAKIGTTLYNSLQDAIDACPGNAGSTQTTITLLKSITTSTSTMISYGKNIKIDLANYNITSTAQYIIENYGTLDLTGQDRNIQNTNDKIAIYNNDNAKLTLNGPNIITTSHGIENNGTITMNSGKIQSNETGIISKYGTIYINGGEITGKNGIDCSSGAHSPSVKIIMTAGKIHANPYYSILNAKEVTITGGEVIAPKGITADKITFGVNDGNVSTTNPTIEGDLSCSSSIIYFYDGRIKSSSIATTHHQGYFLETPNDCSAVKVDDYFVLSKMDAVAYIGEIGYATLQDAIDDSENNIANSHSSTQTTITLAKNDYSSLNTISSGQNIRLDVSSYTLTSPSGYAIINYGNLEIRGTGSITGSSYLIQNTGNLTTSVNLTSTSSVIQNTGTVIVNGGTIYANNTSTNYAIYNQIGTAKVELKAGEVKSNNNYAIYGYYGKVIMSGGTISGKNGITSAPGGSITVSGGRIEASNIGIGNYGTTNISGGYISGSSIDSYSGTGIENYGTTNITGGDIVGYNGIYNGGTLTLGINENSPNVGNIGINGEQYGINVAGGILNFYAGSVVGATNKAIVFTGGGLHVARGYGFRIDPVYGRGAEVITLQAGGGYGYGM